MKNVAAATLALTLVFASATARAEVQTKGPEVFNKVQIGFHPLGFQVGFNNNGPSGYKLNLDVSGLIAPVSFGGIWLGGGFDYTAGVFSCNGAYYYNGVYYGSNCGNQVELWAFMMMTFEKKIPIPLVPFFRAGLGGDILVYGNTYGAFIFRVGGGVHYYLLKWLGLGVETNITMGPGFYNNGTGFWGHWDFGVGARFAF